MRLSELIPRDIISTLLHSNGASQILAKDPDTSRGAIKPGIFVFLLSLADAETPAEEKIFSVSD